MTISGRTTAEDWLEALRRVQVAQVTAARTLDLRGLEIDRVPDLSGLNELRKIDLAFCTELRDISGISMAPNLAFVNLKYCLSLSNINPLSNVPHLKKLNLMLCPQIVSLEALAYTAELKWLTLDFDGEARDTTPLSLLSELHSLTIVATKNHIDVSFLPGLRGLRTLRLLGKVHSIDLDALPVLPNIESIYLAGLDELRNLQALERMPKLKRLKILCSPFLQDFTSLERLPEMRDLRITSCANNFSLTGIDRLPNILRLDLEYVQELENLQALSKLESLTSINLMGCNPALDLADLSAMVRLRRVNLIDGPALRCLQGTTPLASWVELKDLRCNHLRDAPNEIGSQRDDSSQPLDNCLPRIRAWQKDLGEGESVGSSAKVFILGNGSAGKTQICRRLNGLEFDASIPSTHGISLGNIRLAEAQGDLPAVDAHFWDFGGQDVYLGTHALFLDDRAIYVIAWTPSHENTDEFEQNGVPMRNRPLTYWLAYVRALAGPKAPVIVVQTQCDEERQVVQTPPVPADHGFDWLQTAASSAKNEDGLEELRLKLKRAARRQLEEYGKVRLPANWVAVGADLAERRTTQKTMPLAEFEALCRERHRTAVPSVVLSYLHRSGQVFWREGLFGDQVVLDQEWALAGVYAVLDRERSLPILRAQHGRFTPQTLAALVWQDFGEAERKLFLSLMEQCQICFPAAEDLYVAPALLPEEARVAGDIAEVWREAGPEATARLDYAFLHEGVLRSLLCRLGHQAGVRAVYWAWGLCFYDAKAQTTVRIRSALPDVATGATAGTIWVETAGGQAVNMAEQLVRGIVGIGIGQPPEVVWEAAEPAPTDELRRTGEDSSSALVIHAASPPLSPAEPAPVFVSYAWGGESEALVDLIEQQTPAGLRLVRDKRQLRPGDWISSFMKEIGRAQLVVVVLSDKYLKSVYCMRELLYLFQTALGEREPFLQKVVPLIVGDLGLSRAMGRIRWVKHWRQQHDELEAALGELTAAEVGPEDRAELLLMKDFVHRSSEMLAWIGDTLVPQGKAVSTAGVEAVLTLLKARAVRGAMPS